MVKWALSIWLSIVCITFVYSQKVFNYYVSPAGNDSNDGSLNKPFKTFERAKSQVKYTKKAYKNISSINIFFRKGRYVIDKCIYFSNEDGGTEQLAVNYSAYQSENVIVDGGREINEPWVKQPGAKSDLWKVSIDDILKKGIRIEQLFKNERRIPRCSSSEFYTNGANPQYLNKIKKFDFNGLRNLQFYNMDALCSFSYNPKDIGNINIDSINTYIIVYNSWEASWHTIRHIDHHSNVIYFENPLSYPVGFFNRPLRYRLENCKSLLNVAGTWFVDYEKRELWYCSEKSENPNKSKFVIPVVNQFLNIKGNINDHVKNLHFTDIKFFYATCSMGTHTISKQDQSKLVQTYPWLNFNYGYSSYQAGVQDNNTIYFNFTDFCSLANCQVSHIGDYAIHVDKYSSNIILRNLTLNDLGAGGIIIGFDESHPLQNKIPYEASPTNSTIQNCKIFDGGKIKPGAVGIVLMQANHTLISYNFIHNFPYSGMSVGWTWDNSENYTSYNRISNNIIHDVMQKLADGGGIYTLGTQIGSTYVGNYIYNIRRSSGATGAYNNGFFFDQGSSMFSVDSNAVCFVANQDYRFNRADSTKIDFRSNYFQKTSKNVRLLKAIQDKLKYEL